MRFCIYIYIEDIEKEKEEKPVNFTGEMEQHSKKKQSPFDDGGGGLFNTSSPKDVNWIEI